MRLLRFVSRWLGLLALGAALAAIAVDAARSIAHSVPALTELGSAWSAVDTERFAAFREEVATTLAPAAGDWVSDGVKIWVSSLPLSVALTAAGFALVLLGGPARRRAGGRDRA